MKGQKMPKNPSYFFVKGSIENFSEFKDQPSRTFITKFVLSEIQKLVKER